MPATLAPPNLSAPIRPRPVHQRFPASRIVGDMTEDEYLRILEAALEKHIYVDGKVIRVAGASFEHNMLVADTLRTLGNVLEDANNDCEVLPSDQRVYISNNGRHYFPDITVVCGQAQVDDKDALRNPAVIIEVLSDSTQEDDRTDKFADYQTISSLRHYVLIDQYQVAVTHYKKQNDGAWIVVGEHRLADDLTFADLGVSVSLGKIYRRVQF